MAGFQLLWPKKFLMGLPHWMDPQFVLRRIRQCNPLIYPGFTYGTLGEPQL